MASHMSKKILIVEDESGLQKAASKILSDVGYTVFSALDGEAGLRTAAAELPDLILLDLILPKKGGFDVLKELKADEKTKHIPVIILTNLEGSEDVERALALGATTYLVKVTYRLEEVVSKIKEVLG